MLIQNIIDNIDNTLDHLYGLNNPPSQLELLKLKKEIIALMKQMPQENEWEKYSLCTALSLFQNNLLLESQPRTFWLKTCLLCLRDFQINQVDIAPQFKSSEFFQNIQSLPDEWPNQMIDQLDRLINEETEN